MIKVSLPNSQSSQNLHKKEINLSVNKDMSYFVNNKQVGFESLEAELQTEIKLHPDAIVMLRFDKELTIQDLVNVLALGNKLNVKMVLATSK